MKTRGELEREGWERRTVESEPRLSELVTLYEELGFEVRLEPVDTSELPSEDCRRCYLVRSERYRTIYTHRSGDKWASEVSAEFPS
ncbi:MAG TPA: hypothetical protein ENI60_07685 [Candidatus Fraserbacteria bacterium]|nr:hypothetical protein [Candidatus Fraserbacteria bacterium]